MLSVTFRQDGFSIFGHAEFAEHGQDIICSAVSFSAQTVANELQRYDEVGVHAESGMMDVKLYTLSDKSKVLLEYFENSVKILTRQYPKNVTSKKI